MVDSESVPDLNIRENQERRRTAEEYIEQVSGEISRLEQEKNSIENKLEGENDEERIRDLHEELVAVNESLNDYIDQKQKAQKRKGDSYSIADLEDRGYQLVRRFEDQIDEFEDRQNELDEHRKELEELEGTASELLERTTGTALGTQFSKRKGEMERPLLIWKVASAFSIGILIVSAFIIFGEIEQTSTFTGSNISKVALLLPVSVAVWFCVSNYSRQKKLMEEYEFKARMALSLRGFVEVLDEETSENDDEVTAKFVVDTMDKIYSNPQKNIDDEESNTRPTLNDKQ